MARGGLSATRALEIIDFLAARGTTPYTLSELSRELGINVASCHAILLSLVESGHLSRHPKHKTFTLGPALTAIGQVALKNHETIARAQAAAEELSRNEGLEVLLSMCAGGDVLGLAHFQGDGLARSQLRTGKRLPLQAPYGAVFLAWDSEERVASWIARGFDAATGAEVAGQLRLLLDRIRQRGYQIALRPDARSDLRSLTGSWDPDQWARQAHERMRQFEADYTLLSFDPLAAKDDELYDVEYITVPLFDPFNKALYALTVYSFEERLSARTVQEYLSKLLSISNAIRRDT
jgi:DNA-binding IclR family transcriptional regulator